VITYQIERWDTVEAEIVNLAKAHWREVAVLQEKMALALNCEMYRIRDADGSLHITTVRGDGGLAGYYVSFLSSHPHYAGRLCGFLDSYFVHPDFRRANVGLRLFETMESDMKTRGVKALFSSDKNSASLEHLFAYRAWECVGKQYMKWIGD